MKKIFILIIVLFFACSMNLLIGQTNFKHKLDSIVVTSNRTPVTFTKLGRTISVLTKTELSKLPITTVQEALEYVNSLDVKQRGPEGVQADISIRGGTFEQTLILIDGTRLTDPQTAHHNMNLPISLDVIERVEILKGQGSRIHGSNAFGGIINIITKSNASNDLNVGLMGGDNAYYKFDINGSVKLSNTNHFFSISKNKSDGYRFNTNFENINISLISSFNFNSAVLKTILGYTGKDFGANSFYTNKFPNQAEKTRTKFAAITSEFNLGIFYFSPKVYWRGNDDEFLLNKDNPGFYKNNHNTNVFGGEVQATFENYFGSTSFGGEYVLDNISSNNLGIHNRERKGVFFEHRTNLLSTININIGSYLYNYSNIGWKLWPGFDISYLPFSNLKLYANFGKAFRIPTYTEQFYNDPVTMGNSNLHPEETVNYEFGMNFNRGFSNFNLAFFVKEGKNLIDWVKANNNDKWEVRNISSITTRGLELNSSFNFNLIDRSLPLKTIRLSYTFLDSGKLNSKLQSRYILEYLKHQVILQIVHKLPFAITQSWVVKFEDRLNSQDHFIADTKLSKNFMNFNIFVKVTNLFNKIYDDIAGVPLPGRWIIGGVNFNLL